MSEERDRMEGTTGTTGTENYCSPRPWRTTNDHDAMVVDAAGKPVAECHWCGDAEMICDAVNGKREGSGRPRRMSELFDSYQEAVMGYEEEIRLYGCTRLDWGFGKWLWMEAREGEDRLSHWRRLGEVGILTNAGRTALERAERKAGKGEAE